MHFSSVVWAFNFAKVLEPEFGEPVQDELQIAGCEMDRPRHGSQKMLRFLKGSHSGQAEQYVELDIADMMVIHKPDSMESGKLNEVSAGNMCWLSQYLQSLCTWPQQSNST